MCIICVYLVQSRFQINKKNEKETRISDFFADAKETAVVTKFSFHIEVKKWCRGHTTRVSPVELTANRNTTSPKSCPLYNFITAINYGKTILLRTSKRSVSASTVLPRARSIKISTLYPHARGLSPDTSKLHSNIKRR